MPQLVGEEKAGLMGRDHLCEVQQGEVSGPAYGSQQPQGSITGWKAAQQ